jgi:plasmid stabilization system protein ParE
VSWTIDVRPRAAADLNSAYDWYEHQRPGLGNRFLAATAEGFSVVEDLAGRFALYYKDFRYVMVKEFPYKIFYRIEGNVAIVVRVLHASRGHKRPLARE